MYSSNRQYPRLHLKTSRGTNSAENMMEVGSLDMSISWPDWTPQIIYSGAGIGFSEEDGRADSSLVLAGYSQDGVLLYPSYWIQCGTSSEWSHHNRPRVSLRVLCSIPLNKWGMGQNKLGFLYEGTLSFDVFDTSEGAPVIGTLGSDISYMARGP